MLLISQKIEISRVTPFQTLFLNNLVGFLLPRIHRQFLQISISFSVEEKPPAFVKTWFSERHECEPGKYFAFCCSAAATKSDSSFTWNSEEKMEFSVHDEKFLKQLLKFKSFTRLSPLNSYSLDLQRFKWRDYCLQMFHVFKVSTKSSKLSAISPQRACINYKCRLKNWTFNI